MSPIPAPLVALVPLLLLIAGCGEDPPVVPPSPVAPVPAVDHPAAASPAPAFVPTGKNLERQLLEVVPTGDAVSVLGLLAEGADIDHRAEVNLETGMTPLLLAMQNGKVDIVRILVEKGAVLDPADPLLARIWGSATKRGEEWVPLVDEKTRAEIETITAGARKPARDGSPFLSDELREAFRAGPLEALRAAAARTDPASRDPEGRTMLMLAMLRGDPEVGALAKELVAHGVPVHGKDHQGRTALHAAAGCGSNVRDKVACLLDLGAEDVPAKNGRTALMVAAGNNDRATVELLLKRGADLHAKDRWGATAYEYARTYGNLDLCAWLQQQAPGVELDRRKLKEDLLAAIQEGRTADVRSLVERGADVEEAEYWGITPLAQAARYRNIEIVDFLLGKHARPDPRGPRGETPLMLAATYDALEIAERLLAAGADPALRDWEGHTALDRAVQGGRVAIVERLRAASRGGGAGEGGGDEETLMARLVEASTAGDVTFLTQAPILDRHLQRVNPDGTTLLNLAARSGRVAVLETLIQRGAAVDGANAAKETPLMWAIAGDQADAVKLLVARGAALEARDQYGRTPLMWACWNGRVAIARALVAAGARLDTRDDRGQGPLELAAQGGKQEIITWLQQAGSGAGPSDEQRRGRDDALLVACRINDLKQIEALLAIGTSPDGGKGASSIPLVEAAAAGHLDAVRVLVGGGAKVDAKDGDGKTALMAASLWHHHQTVDFLLANKADVGLTDAPGHNAGSSTALLLATPGGGYTPQSGQDRLRTLQALLDGGAKIDARNQTGETPLIRAAGAGEQELDDAAQRAVLELLLSRGADVNLLDQSGRTALHAAIDSGRRSAAEMLVLKGARADAGGAEGRQRLEWLAEQNGMQAILKLMHEVQSEPRK